MPPPSESHDCPKCGTRLKYDQTLGSVHLYICGEHGSVLVWPSGRIEVLVQKPKPT